MSRKELAALGLELPILPTTSVGSFPKPDSLKVARTKHRQGKLTDAELKVKEDEATKFWIEQQEKIGIDVLVDGEQYRGDMVEYFAENMDGFKISGLVRSYGNRYYRKPIISGKLGWRGPITVDRWKFAQAMTEKPLKGMLTGPYTIMDWSFNESYKTRKDATFALADQIRAEVEALVKAGARIIQVDEPALSTRRDEVKMALTALCRVTKGIKAYFITHCCYGDFASIYKDLQQYMTVNNLDIELSNSNLDLLDFFKKKGFKKDISAGVVDVHSHNIESEDIVLQRINRVVASLGPEQVWIDPDCGLKTRTVNEAIGKLCSISAAVAKARTQLGAKEKAVAAK